MENDKTTVTSGRRPVGRPKTMKRKDERMPPTYVTKETADRWYAEAAKSKMEWSEFSRQAVEFFIAHRNESTEEIESERKIIPVTVESQVVTKLADVARPFGYREVAHFIEDLAARSTTKTPAQIKEYLLGDIDE